MTKEADLREVCRVARNPGIPFADRVELGLGEAETDAAVF
jgi:hypothetical protein